MTQFLIVGSLVALAVTFSLVGFLARPKGFVSISEFFLADSKLKPAFITSLLISGSFSLNGMLYQTYLGYKIGAWALLTQFAWAASFFLLANFKDQLAGSSSLHSFLGKVFSPGVRVLAALCSIAGLALQLGWEYSVSGSAISALTVPALPPITTSLVVFTVFAVSTFYTLAGGMRSNSVTDMVQNIVKGAAFVAIGLMVYGVVFTSGLSSQSLWSAAFPPFSATIAELTVTGLLANLAFSLTWQFVDMSTWQTALATNSSKGNAEVGSALRWAGIWVFVAPGVIGTILGIGIGHVPNLTSDNILSAVVHTLSGYPWLTVILTLAIGATIMSFVDGMMLAIGFTVITDLFFRHWVDKYKLLNAPDDETRADPEYQRVVTRILFLTRLTIVATAVLGTYALTSFATAFGTSLFGLVYIVTISQLPLIGPVLVALLGRKPRPFIGEAAILLGLVAGFGLSIYGNTNQSSDIANAALMAAIGVSLVIAFLGSSPGTAKPVTNPKTA